MARMIRVTVMLRAHRHRRGQKPASSWSSTKHSQRDIGIVWVTVKPWRVAHAHLSGTIPVRIEVFDAVGLLIPTQALPPYGRAWCPSNTPRMNQSTLWRLSAVESPGTVTGPRPGGKPPGAASPIARDFFSQTNVGPCLWELSFSRDTVRQDPSRGTHSKRYALTLRFPAFTLDSSATYQGHGPHRLRAGIRTSPTTGFSFQIEVRPDTLGA